MDNSGINGFVRISKYAGMREDLAQAGGGNSSYKSDSNRMYIKASGYQLTEVSPDEGYAVVDPQQIRDFFTQCEDLDEITEADSKEILAKAQISGRRPSIETFLHAVSGTYTLHTHPTVVNILASRAGGMEVLGELFPEALIVPYAKPGVELAKAYFKAYRQKGCAADVVFLQNHGLVVSGENADAVIALTEEITLKLEAYLGLDLSACHDATRLWGMLPSKTVWLVNDRNVREVYLKNGCWNHAFCPDCVVFLGKKFLELEDTDPAKLEEFRAEYGEPAVLVYNGNLFLTADSVKKAMEMQSVLSFSAQVMAANAGCDTRLLTEEQQNELLNWDAEKYRKAMK